MISIQPAFSFDLAKMRYLDNTLGNSYAGKQELTETEAANIASDLRDLQNQLDRSQRALTDMFQTYRSAKSRL